ncbi:DUF421 domain-containing protein [Siminovitchia sp. 179-K 8D1 HS]|uniref:DUF421 domain-containing protein n=1 Tax=Siminovitchia sp. 179-K 8D1 HS TaxID=3142385 RepID=UPI0039A34E32
MAMLYLDTVMKLALGLGALLIVTRVLGKKEMGQFTPFDFIYALVLGALLEESLYDEKVSLWQMLFGVAVWGVLIYIVEVIVAKNSHLRKFLKGTTARIIKDGELNLEKMKKNHLEMETLRTMLRQQGIFSLKEVRDLYLEPSGTISVKKHPSAEPPTAEKLQLEIDDEAPSILLIDEGRIEEDMVELIGKSKNWLLKELEKEGYPDIGRIVYAEWSKTEGFYVKTYD